MSQRTAWLKRYTPVKRRRERARRTSCWRSRPWLDAVKLLTCVGLPDGSHAPGCPRVPPCDPSHVGDDGGGSMKCSDNLTVPHSRECHNEYERAGAFTKPEKRAWWPGKVAETQVTVTAALAGIGGVAW